MSSSSSSVSSNSNRSFNPMPVRPDFSQNCITLNGDPMPMSVYPDPLLNFDAAMGVPENIMGWLQGVWDVEM
jgi:hypothetical protein